MMKKYSALALLAILFLTLGSCRSDDVDDVVRIQDSTALDTHKFVYDALDIFYLYKAEKEVLTEGYFQTLEEKEEYLSQFETPEDLFDDLKFEDDRFSILVPDYHDLENQLDGIGLNNGMDYGLGVFSGSDEVFGFVRYVLPGTSAEEEGVKRGMLFNRIDGERMTLDNYQDLLNGNTYAIGLMEVVETTDGINTLSETEDEITLTKTKYNENPIYLKKVLEVGGKKIGYLVYNSFIASYDEDLNDLFAEFKSEGIDELIIDLRYNGGGSVDTCKNLAGMITGQFNDKVFATENHNALLSEAGWDIDILFSDRLKGRTMLNSLNMNRVYIIGTGSSASASELLINGLKPYIDVVQVGETTVGKFQGSIMVYDSDDFSREAVLPGHTYAMLPLIMKLTNADGVSDYVNGLSPDIKKEEDIADMGELGDEKEPLLQAALQDITGSGAIASYRAVRSVKPYKIIGERGDKQLNYQKMVGSGKPFER